MVRVLTSNTRASLVQFGILRSRQLMYTHNPLQRRPAMHVILDLGHLGQIY
jgi:hypothetical protein